MTAEEVSSTLARLRLQIADSDYAAMAELERLRPLVDGRHASVLQRIQRCTESLETEAALQALEQLARSMAVNRTVLQELQMFEALTGPELPTVLIVDDERLNRSMLAELLSPTTVCCWPRTARVRW